MKLQELIKQIEYACYNFISIALGINYEQAHFKPSPETWSVTENVENMVWAEQGGINGIWKAVAGIKIMSRYGPRKLFTRVYLLSRLSKEPGDQKK